MAVTLPSARMVSLSTACFDRSSWMIPMSVFVRTTNRNAQFFQAPTENMRMASTMKTPLKYVNTLLLMMSETLFVFFSFDTLA